MYLLKNQSYKFVGSKPCYYFPEKRERNKKNTRFLYIKIALASVKWYKMFLLCEGRYYVKIYIYTYEKLWKQLKYVKSCQSFTLNPCRRKKYIYIMIFVDLLCSFSYFPRFTFVYIDRFMKIGMFTLSYYNYMFLFAFFFLYVVILLDM